MKVMKNASVVVFADGQVGLQIIRVEMGVHHGVL
jgi:hypothetical protein